ncbi:MAG: chorismate-binding protein [Actinomycetota bacterium]|nr:chorismate-binding protein [Actinomycetota bacterium]
MTSLLEGVVAGDYSAFALVNRHDSSQVEVLVGSVIDVSLISEIPLWNEHGEPREVLALVPFQQIRERGFAARVDGSPLRSLVIEQREQVAIDKFLALAGPSPALEGEQGFDVSDADYADTVGRIIADEIGRGEGSNFVIRRDYRAHTSMAAHSAVIAWLAALLAQEAGAAWTFAVCTPGLSMVGASPEQHLSVAPTGELGRSLVQMNPIAGTYRHPVAGATAEGLLDFLHNRKEQEELFMVVDEELKMMSRICSSEVRVRGPFLKQMAHLTHSEYVIEGMSNVHPLDALRQSMFAPTITGSPMQNACAVIAKYEPTGRGYYAGVLALFEVHSKDGHSLDAPILIRTAYLDGKGDICVPVGATLVRHSDPVSEVAETLAKSRGVLQAIGARGARAKNPRLDLAQLPAVDHALQVRNSGLSGFWLQSKVKFDSRAGLSGTAVVVDAEDDFSAMLVQQLRALGMSVALQAWSEPQIADCDLLVAGPGPGNPSDLQNPRIARMHEVIRQRRASGRGLLAVCLSHQILATQLGLRLERLDQPRQGLVLTANVLGQRAQLGHYNSFSAVVDQASRPPADVCVHTEPDSEAVSSLSGAGFSSVQGHPESVLSRDGLLALKALATHALLTPNAAGHL